MKRCCVAGCNRQTSRFVGPGQFWICGRHWRLIPGIVKDEHKAAKRELRAAARRCRGSIVSWAQYRAVVALRCREVCAWLACIREAQIAAAMGAR
jgi:hypothetical protein